jgi:plastin-1
MHSHTLQVIGGKSEDDLLKWANDMVNKEPRVGSFRDKSLKNSVFFINLMGAIEPRAINWDLVVQDNDSDETLESNAKYAISIARKLGASIFLVWEDIKEVKGKMLMTFVAGLYDIYLLEFKLKNEKNKIKEQQNVDVNLGLEK